MSVFSGEIEKVVEDQRWRRTKAMVSEKVGGLFIVPGSAASYQRMILPGSNGFCVCWNLNGLEPSFSRVAKWQKSRPDSAV